MGYGDDFRIPVSDTQAYKQFGSACPVFEAVARIMQPPHSGPGRACQGKKSSLRRGRRSRRRHAQPEHGGDQGNKYETGIAGPPDPACLWPAITGCTPGNCRVSPISSFRATRPMIYVHGCFWHGHDCHLFRMPATRRGFWEARDQPERHE